jgi:hypothetical protein
MRGLLVTDILLGGVGGVALVLTYRYLWVPLNIAVLRQRVFKLRRELFLYAADGNVSFDARAYVQLNDTLNSLIGFADKVTVFEALVCAVFVAKTPYVDATADAIRKVEDQKVRGTLEAMHAQIHREIVRHLALTSPLFWLLVLPSGLYVFIRHMFHGTSPAEAARHDTDFPARAIEAGVRAREHSSGVWKPWTGEGERVHAA